MIGGVVSAIGDQDFLSGFQTAAFARLLNDENKLMRRNKAIVKAISPKECRSGRKWGVYVITPVDENGNNGLTVQKLAAGRWFPSNLLYGQNDQSTIGATGMPFSESFIVDPNSWLDNLIYHESLMRAVRNVLRENQ